MKDKYDREKERESRKAKLEHTKTEEKKDDARRESQNLIREEKRKLDKALADKLRKIKFQNEEDIDAEKDNRKKQIQKQFEMKEMRAESDF